ncbi:MAG TPA: alpha/beta hydrolase [Solirubrobacteraceae bacterium]|nr:alpha/beta hydrolase [Solirubrobacteraceae bacterium]
MPDARPSELIVESGGSALAASDVGDGPAVLCLHGLTATRRYVLMGSRGLERGGHRVLAYDARGHGRSTPAPTSAGYGYEHLARDAVAVLDSAAIGSAVLVGVSMGAHTAARVALEHPARVRGLVLVTPAYDPDRHGDRASLARWDRLSEGLRQGGVEGFVSAYGEPPVPGAWRETVVAVLRQRLAAHQHPEAVADALRAVPRSRPFGELDHLRQLRMPVLIVASRDEADPEHPVAVARAWAQRMPRCRLVMEEPGRSPLAWQGGQLSRLVAGVANHA